MVRSQRILGIALEIGVPILILVAWGVWSANADNVFFPPLTTILDTFRDTWVFAHVGSDLVPSVARMLVGFAVAAMIGVAIGTVLGMSTWARQAATPIIEFLRAIPPPALIPFGIVVLGISDQMKVLIIALVCVFPVLLNTIDAVRGLDPTFIETGRIYGVRGHERLRGVILPAAMPQIFAGLRTSLSLALIMMVVSEMLASTNGVGYFVLHSQRLFSLPEMWSGMLLLGLLGYTLNLLLAVIEHRVLHWHRGARRVAT